MDLICESPGKINLPYIIWFISFGVGGVLTFPVIDKFGRRRSHLIFSTMNMLAQALITFVPSFFAHAIGFALLGFFMAKQALCLTWAFELLQSADKSFANMCLMSLDFSIIVVSGLYFYFAEVPDWKILCYPQFFLGALGYVLCTFLIPESPKWLLL